jgi:hypothetical protein
MREIGELEDKAAKVEASGVNTARLKTLLGELAEARKNLARLSDGCGPGRSN